MQERKLNDTDIGFGMTDDAIIETLKELAIKKSKDSYVYRVLANSLDLIHRLQGERKDMHQDLIQAEKYAEKLSIENAEQKAEIERLTEEKDKYQDKWQTAYMNELNLQKQVDELKEYTEDIYKKAIDREEDAYSLGFDKGKEQAVKDTAKEILGVILAKEFEKGDYLTDNELHEIFKERYGVEVE